MKEGILCQCCGIEAPTRKVSFHQNIGMVVLRQSRSLDGFVCKNCLHSKFWRMTGITLGVGWLGTISLVMAPFIVINNTVHYLSKLTMPPVPPDAQHPVLDDATVQRIALHLDAIFKRANENEPLHAVVRDIAPRARATPGQVLAYVIAVVEQQRRAQAPAPVQRGFDVVRPTATPPPLPQ